MPAMKPIIMVQMMLMSTLPQVRVVQQTGKNGLL